MTATSAQGAAPHMSFTVPPLPYAFDALEPYIDAKTMEIHHDKHHAAYVTNVNKALESAPDFAKLSVEDLCAQIGKVPENIRTAVRNNGGGHVNHTMFWEIMGPNKGGNPSGAIADVVKNSLGGFDKFKEAFEKAGLGQFGSGWAWLVRTKGGEFKITSTPNQDNPMSNGDFPILGNDVWEHAYYLKYQNRRGDYLKAWWNVVNWDEVNKRLAQAK
jgi:superoxide dismutase, Fe-Mn family